MSKYSSSQYHLALRLAGIKSANNRSQSNQEIYKCPFHKDDHPSMGINFSKGIYHCFSCGSKGSIQKLISLVSHKSMDQVLGISFTDDFQGFIDAQGKITPVVPAVREPSKVSIPSVDIRGVFIPFDRSPKALTYLEKRYISLRVAKEMNMQYSEYTCINGTVFKDRLVIPIYNTEGRVLNVEGRDTTFTSSIKCIYPKGATKPVYEWYKLDKEKPLYIFEGLIKMAVARDDLYFSNSTSTLGVMVSELQMSQLKGFSHIVIVPDNDDAGQKLIPLLRMNLTSTRIDVLRIKDNSIKDADEIPSKTGKTIEQFRLDGGFDLEISLED
jgi:DNA primase